MQSPFDIMADTYDANFTNTSIGVLQRQQVWQSLTGLLKSYQRPVNILEINCGTGEDALTLSRGGHAVTATDGSARMIEKAIQKAAVAGVGNICFRVCRFDQLHQDLQGKQFDIIMSNFGGLNCIDAKELTKLGQQLHALLQDDGKLFLVLMTRACIWEIFFYLFKGKPRTAFRRKSNSVVFQSGDTRMPIFYYSPSILKKIFRHGYRYLLSYPVGLFVPPSYLQRTFENRKRWLRTLVQLDKMLCTNPAFANLSDHFCILFQKNGSL